MSDGIALAIRKYTLHTRNRFSTNFWFSQSYFMNWWPENTPDVAVNTETPIIMSNIWLYSNIHYIWIWKFYDTFVYFWIRFRCFWRFWSIANWKRNTSHSCKSCWHIHSPEFFEFQSIFLIENFSACPVIIAQTTTKQAAMMTNTRVEL